MSSPAVGPRGAARTRGDLLSHVTLRSAGIAVAATLILAVAAYLRFRGLGHARMSGDQSMILGTALRFVRGGPLPLTANKASAGIMNPPLLEYLLALPLVFKQTVVSAVAFTALLGLLAVAACGWIVGRLAGWRAGLIAALLFATNPWAVYYSRFIWNPNLVPLFSTLLVGFLLLHFAAGRRPVYLALSLLWLAAVVQLHLAALVLILVVGLICLLFWRRLSLKGLLLGGALFVLSFLPYLFYMASTRFADLRAMASALGGQKAELNAAAFLLIRDLASGHGLLESNPTWQAAVWPWEGLTGVEAWVFAASLLYAAGYLLVRGRRALFRRRPEPLAATFAILLVWVLVPGLAYFRHTMYLQNYYFVYIYPVPFMLIGVAADHALRTLHAVGRRGAAWPEKAGGARARLRSFLAGASRAVYYPVAALLLGALLAIGLWQTQSYHVRLDLFDQGVLHNRQAQDIDRLVDSARALEAARPGCGLIVVSQGATAQESPFGLLADFLPPGVRYVQSGSGLIVPSGCATYLDTTGGGWLQAWLGEGMLEPAGEETTGGDDTWRFYAKPAGALQPARAEPLAEWVNGARLWDCWLEGTPDRGGTAELTLLWQATQPGGTRVLHFFSHLVYEPDGRMVSQLDGPGVHSAYWQAGDFLVTRFSIPIPQDAPAGRYELRVGMYGLVDKRRVSLVGGSDALAVADMELPAGE